MHSSIFIQITTKTKIARECEFHVEERGTPLGGRKQADN